jgi:hypothetical protein
MQVKSNEVWILGNAPFKCSASASFDGENKTVSFTNTGGVEITAGGLTISNGAFTCKSSATFNSNVTIASKNLLSIENQTLGKLAFED